MKALHDIEAMKEQRAFIDVKEYTAVFDEWVRNTLRGGMQANYEPRRYVQFWDEPAPWERRETEVIPDLLRRIDRLRYAGIPPDGIALVITHAQQRDLLADPRFAHAVMGRARNLMTFEGFMIVAAD